MNRPVPLIRRFTSISTHYQAEDVELEQIWSILGRGERTEWGQLRDEFRVVVLADAGAGKTFELQAEAGRLVASGRAAFFIRIEDIDAAFGSAFEVGTSAAFDQWLAGTEEAWFFLDSVDEVRLEAPRAFETAIRAFASRIHDARQRAHIYISSRPYAWRSTLDRALVEELLPYEPPIAEPSGEDGETPSRAKNGREILGLRLYRLAPLDPDDIRIFAGHRGVADADALIDALERTQLFGLAQLPFDLEDILAVWNETGSLDSRLAVLERGLQRRLAPSPSVRGALALDRALEGARRLALAATLTGETNIRMPGAGAGGLDATAILFDWSDAEVRQLLSRGVFSDAIYSMTRFRHRESRELLAAQWLAQLLDDPENRSAAEALLFRQIYGEAVIVPRTRPLLPWLILFDAPVRDRALALQPRIATEGGDPARLPHDVRKRILRDIVSRIVAGDSRGGDNSEIARIFDKSARSDGAFERSDFTFDHEDDSYICPAGKRLRPRNRNFTSPRPEADQDGFIRYRARQQDCSNCTLKPKCTPILPARKLTRSIHEGARDLARALSQEDEWIASRRERKKVEMLFAHLKRIMRLDRLRLRGPNGARDEFHLAAAAQNLRKLAKISIARQMAMA